MTYGPQNKELSTTFDRLDDALTAFTFESTGLRPSPAADRWVLASNLQKAIRRGLHGAAALTAHWLHDIDPSYVWQRLRIIAYEDIGLGDARLCQDVLEVCASAQFQRSRGPSRVAACLAMRLATARKSRALCDLSVILDMQQRRDNFRSAMTALASSEVIELCCNTEAAPLSRAAALRHVAGYRVSTFRTVNAYVRPNPLAMEEIAERSHLTATHRTLYLLGQKGAEGMNAFVPLVAGTVDQVATIDEAFSFEGSRGILFSALDKHTRVGGRCITSLLRREAELTEFFACAPRPAAAFASMLFFVEGGLLNRNITCELHRVWGQECETEFVRSFGLDPETHAPARKLVERYLGMLNELRLEELA